LPFSIERQFLSASKNQPGTQQDQEVQDDPAELVGLDNPVQAQTEDDSQGSRQQEIEVMLPDQRSDIPTPYMTQNEQSAVEEEKGL
jgi:hypothetical protein